MRTRIGLVTVLVAAAAALAGCGGPTAGPYKEMAEVKGKVTLGGKPADRLTMNFTPVDAATGREDACAVLNGEYTTKLVTGKYKVWFEAPARGPIVPTRYRSAAGTDLELDTAQGGKDFDLK